MKPLLKLLASLEITIGSFVLGMVLILFGTIDQVNLGIHGATEKYFHTVFVTQYIPSIDINIPYMPGGYLIGFVLLVNMIAAIFYRFRMSTEKLGIWMVHFGFILLLLGEFISSVFQHEASLTINEGETVDFTESFRESELAIIDTTFDDKDRVYAIPQAMLEREQQVSIEELPFNISIDEFLPNSVMQRRNESTPDSARLANQGIGLQAYAIQVPETGKMNDRNVPATIVTLFSKDSGENGSEVIGTWLAREFVPNQTFSYRGRNYTILMRREREMIDYAVTLKDFSHDRYLGTNIPKNFSSEVTVRDKTTGLEQDFLIYMNNPLRYDDLTFYQQGFMNDDTTTILQVVRNPGRSLPYISTSLMTLGLVVQFGFSLQRFSKKRKKAAA
ncbi:cytochrome c biogenesis protein ResB [Pelagicoccus sp. SDUM812002]|uniref:cytochrome c biogenesis protein ResB n=1 Tax=Pelagicoccus sp. SDUM812002 TaxID=3041266 RepID=UPI00280FFFFD|nr:cytochrome c biogenesis protein ResB [Pelagicoccus sp. SDUM812002]MDQ8187574.1 cytochrome c biogenesis protein ResB [Pelagicoccus sp. SDUM812002]